MAAEQAISKNTNYCSEEMFEKAGVLKDSGSSIGPLEFVYFGTRWSDIQTTYVIWECYLRTENVIWYLWSEICDLRSEIWDLWSEICNLWSEIWNLWSEICDLWSEICDLRFVIWDLWSVIWDLRSEVWDLRSEICDLRSGFFKNVWSLHRAWDQRFLWSCLYSIQHFTAVQIMSW